MIIVISKNKLCVTKSYQPSRYVGRFPKNVRVYVILEMQFYKYVSLFVLFCFIFMYFYYKRITKNYKTSKNKQENMLQK